MTALAEKDFAQLFTRKIIHRIGLIDDDGQILLGEGMEEAASTTDVQRLMAGRGAVNTLRKAVLLNGVDLMRSGGFTSIVHGDQELNHTINAFDQSLETLQREGLV